MTADAVQRLREELQWEEVFWKRERASDTKTESLSKEKKFGKKPQMKCDTIWTGDMDYWKGRIGEA